MPVSRFRTAYGPKGKVFFVQNLPSRTKQSFKDECDINTIMRRYEQTGVLSHVSKRVPQYIDATGLEYQAAMQLVIDAGDMFNSLPSKVRERFHNDPAEMLAFIENDSHFDEAKALGLLKPDAVKPDAAPAPIMPDVKPDVKA